MKSVFLSVLTLAAALFCYKQSWSQETNAEDPQPVATATPLNIEPMAEVIIPPGRPDWIGANPVRDTSVYQTAVKSDPFVRRADCERALNKEIAEAVDEYIREQTGSRLAAALLAYDVETIKQRFLTSTHRYEETIVSPSVGEMHQIHALLEFPEEFRQEVARRWLQVRSASRLGQVGLLFAAVLSMIGTAFGFFRVDNATRGYYTGRLQIVAGVAMLILVVGGIFVARSIPWI